jgi:hypothetical protein
MVPSNFELKLESTGREHFDMAMKMCFENHSKATRYRFDNGALHLMWYGEQGQPLPYVMDQAAAAEFAWNWLKTADRGKEPDMDGSCYPNGFRVESRSGFGNGNTFVIVQAVWAEYHK